jgi:hypothetical protein
MGWGLEFQVLGVQRKAGLGPVVVPNGCATQSASGERVRKS